MRVCECVYIYIYSIKCEEYHLIHPVYWINYRKFDKSSLMNHIFPAACWLLAEKRVML